MSPPLWSSVDNGYVNPYTCRTLLRLDRVIYFLRGKKTRWAGKNSGHLIIGNAEARTHFPGWMFKAATYVQNRWVWTRRLLSL